MIQIFTGNLLLDIIGIVIALVVTVYAYFKWSFQYWRRRNVPCIEPEIPFGSGGNPIKRMKTEGSHMSGFYKTGKANGWRHCGFYFLTAPRYYVMDLDLIKHIMTKDFQHFVDRGTYYNEKDDPISESLFALGGQKWRNLRVKLTPTFTSGKMKTMFHTLAECGTILEKYVEDKIQVDDAIDIKNILGHFSTDVIGSCAFGIECNSFKDENSPFRVYSKKLFSFKYITPLKAIIINNFPNLGRKLRMRLFPEDISDFFTKVVEDTIEYREKNNFKRKDLLQMLIDSKNDEIIEDNYEGDGKSLTTKEIVAQSFLFFLAGFETSSTTMTFALFELANHPEIQDRVRKEINEVLAKHNNEISYDSLSEMKYMKQVIDETLRIYSPVPILTRVCVEDWKVPGEDVIIEKGTNIVIPVTQIHHDQRYYEDPEKFDPERFTEENKRNRHQYAHIPFGEGPRVCIGERFGLMQTKVGITTIIKNFQLSVHEKTQIPLKMIPRAFIPSVEGGIWLKIKKL